MSAVAASPDYRTLDLTAAVSRFGVAYVRNVCAQAHIGFNETSPGEDSLALDGSIEFAASPTRVQIKATTRWSLSQGSEELLISLEDGWREKWSRQQNPAYLIAVLLKRNPSEWISHPIRDTHVGAFALWSRIDTLRNGEPHVTLSRTRRFTAETIVEWGKFLDDRYAAYRKIQP